ncbi:thioredoxin domain-containing protein [Carboxylicivirga sp. RSCT41]|uniref:thioredoxin domain-containing protein n=1 Tax=Carboxylicivirga agarovorans TaxID=3417570 RepID=UPI003D330AD6
MKKLLLALTAVIISVNLMAQGIEFEHGTFVEALARAKAENKLVFMDCYTTWCGPCKQLARDIFPQKEVGDLFNKQFVNLKVDMEKGEGPELAEKYGVKAFPTLLFMDSEGNVLHKVVGGTDVAGLIEHAGVAKDPSKQIGTMHKRYADGERDVVFLSEYIQALYGAYEREKMLPVGQEFIANTPKDQLANVNAFTVIGYSSALEYGSDTYQYIIANKEKFIAAEGIGQENYDGVMGQCVNAHLMKKAESTNSLDELMKEIEKVKEEFDSPQSSMMEGRIINTFYLSHKQYDNWFDASVRQAEEAGKQDARMGESILIQTAYQVSMDPQFAESGLYPKAIDMVEGLLKEDAENLAAYYCLACLYKCVGNKEKALSNVNAFMTKNVEKGGQNDARVEQLKKDIELM